MSPMWNGSLLSSLTWTSCPILPTLAADRTRQVESHQQKQQEAAAEVAEAAVRKPERCWFEAAYSDFRLWPSVTWAEATQQDREACQSNDATALGIKCKTHKR